MYMYLCRDNEGCGQDLGHSNVFFCFASDENLKTYQPAREKKQTGNLNKTNTDLVNQLK